MPSSSFEIFAEFLESDEGDENLSDGGNMIIMVIVYDGDDSGGDRNDFYLW